MKTQDMLDLYSDFLITQNQRATATGLSDMTEGAVTHDEVTQFLNGKLLDTKTLWQHVKPMVRQHETEGPGVLIIDDTIEEKPYTDENLINTWHYSHTEGRVLKGMNLLTCLIRYGEARIPVYYEVVRKEQHYCDLNTKKEVRQARRSKNEMFRDCVGMALHNGVQFAYVLADNWFSSKENMLYLHKRKQQFIFGLKTNRLVATSKQDARRGRHQRLELLNFGEHEAKTLWLKEVPFPVKVARSAFTNADDSEGVLYLVSNDLSLDAERLWEVYQKRWAIEEFHKSIKQNASLEKSPTRTVRSQCNHIFAAIIAYCKLEALRLKTKLNHFALKYKLLLKANQAAMNAFRLMQAG